MRDQLFTLALRQLRPTQMSVGARAVQEKSEMLRQMAAAAHDDYLAAHPVPVVAGPGAQWFALDRHHLCSAAEQHAVERVYCVAAGDCSASSAQTFWEAMFARGWAYPYDEHGVRRALGTIPQRFSDLPDDPYRSLAAALRNAGGYAKTAAPFAEFRWADYLRRQVPVELVTGCFDAALAATAAAALMADAAALPGYRGQPA